MLVPPILDVTCGSRMAWHDKDDPRALFVDNRKLETLLCDGRTLIIQPDQIEDFRDLSFPENSFYLVFFDPPHLKHLSEKSYMAKKYGVLHDGWEEDIRKGFSECFRVLKPGGTLVFKWSDGQIPLSKVLRLALPEKPLFGQRCGFRGNAVWTIFLKSPSSGGQMTINL